MSYYGVGSTTEDASEFTVDRRMQQPDPSCDICLGSGTYTGEAMEQVAYACEDHCQGRSRRCAGCDGTGQKWYTSVYETQFKCDCSG
ncbi:hypothetical protein IFM58399_07326 [Aspergillus lentulus]|uniref:uncharacterized protein n=1 Tax=Aspergillus lentulus TaxID=293939 RepID=UPI001393B867|nr:uncharacterized protein IFM58399_07326 [Aspergillus lentulus]GFF44574.1 hypothetical protein IFM58399_07326 [Aspergillus lentulus]GFF68874.1 hypothetical protein IFM62136_07421 [Aspergillus lentulus]